MTTALLMAVAAELQLSYLQSECSERYVFVCAYTGTRMYVLLI